MAALIHSFIIPEDERVLQTERVKYMLQIAKKGYLTKGEVEQTFEEWKDIARRLCKGKEMLDELQKTKSGKLENNPQYIALTHLYEFLVKICGIYCLFFEDMFQEKKELFQKSVDHICNIICKSPSTENTGA